jgi:hypothetical protein
VLSEEHLGDANPEDLKLRQSSDNKSRALPNVLLTYLCYTGGVYSNTFYHLTREWSGLSGQNRA